MLDSSAPSALDHPLSDEREVSQRKNPLKRQPNCAHNLYALPSGYHRLKPTAEKFTPTTTPTNQPPPKMEQTNASVTDDDAMESLWSSSDDDHHSVKSSPLTAFYSHSSSSSGSSFDLCSNSSDSHHTSMPNMQMLLSSSSSGYESSLNSIPDHLFASSPDSISIPDYNLVDQFVSVHRPKQMSFDPDFASSSPPSSFSSTSSSFFSPESIPNVASPSYCRKYVSHNQASSDTDDDSQATTTSMSLLSIQQKQQSNYRPRSLPIAIQQSKGSVTEDDTDHSSQNSPSCPCSMSTSQNARFRPCGLSPETFLKSNLVDKSLLSEQTTINHKNALDHFIMSPTDKVKVQMKYHENDTKSNELQISQPEDIDFKRSKLKAVRVLYQNRISLNSISSPVTPLNLAKQSSRKQSYCDSPLAKPTSNPRLFRSALSYSVFEADDEHEVVLSTARSGVNGTHEKSPMETFNSLRVNFTESLLNGKILPCGALDGFTVKLGASGLFVPKQVVLPVTTFWFNVSEHQAASPYLGFINLQSLPKRGYHTPTKGTITLALLNPNGTAVHLFLVIYDFSDMPADHRTFIRQRIVLMPENSKPTSKENLRYLAHIRFVTSQTGKLYMHSDIRLIFARNKLDYDERAGNGKPQLVTLTDVPTPRYWPRK